MKTKLKEYSNLRKEIPELNEQIGKIQKRLNVMERKGYKVIDSVSGGNGGSQHFKVEGFPYPEYTKVKTRLLQRQQLLSKRKERAEELLSEIDGYINSIESSEVRRIINLKYVEDLTWQQTAERMGEYYTEDGCRMILERYLKSSGDIY